MGVPGTVETVPGAVVGDTDPAGAEGKKAGRDPSMSRSRNYTRRTLNQNPSKILVEINGLIL